MTDLVIRKPLSAWNAELKLDWNKVFSTVAKTALKVASAKFDEALDEATGLLEAVGIAEKAGKPEVLAWLLINRALARAVLALLVEARERHPDMAFKVEGDGAAVFDVQRLMDDEFTVGRDFLNRPENLDVLVRAKPVLREWFVGLGLGEGEAGALEGRIEALFASAMRDEWLERARDYSVLRGWVATPLDAAVERQEAWDRAISEIKLLPLESVFGEAFSLEDVFVPLRAYIVDPREEDEGRGWRERHGESEPMREPKAQIVWLRDEILRFIKGDDRHDALRVISGGPGSGKSSAAAMLAAELVDQPNFRVLYIPLHRYRLGGVMRDEVARYCKTWLFEFDMDPLDALEDDRVLVIFFDGLDELTSRGKAAQTEANEFAQELRTFLNEENRRQTRVKVIIGGRELVVQSTSDARFREAPVLHLAPFSVDEEFKARFDWQDEARLLELDQRDKWWRKFAAVTDGPDDKLPDGVRNSEQLSSLTAQPLLNYLVAGYLTRRGDESASDISVNEVYRELVNHVYERRWGRTAGGPSARDLVPKVDTADKFFAVLEEIALAVWHAGGRAVRFETVEAYLDNAGLSGLVAEMQTTLEGGVANLLVTFFFRKQRGWRGDESVEFTHKSFQEYLCARRLRRAAEEIAAIAATERRLREALLQWAELTGPALLTREIFDFLIGEVTDSGDPERLRMVSERLCALLSEELVNGFPMEDVKGPCGIRRGASEVERPGEYKSMRDWAERSELALLAALNATCRALNAGVADDMTGTIRARIGVPDRFALHSLLQRLQALEMRDADRIPSRGLANKILAYLDPIIGPWLDVLNKSDNGKPAGGKASHYLVLADLSRADLFRADLIRANLTGAHLFRADLTGADLSGAHLTGADLTRAHLTRAHLTRAHLARAILTRADLTGADLSGADLFRADLIRANLTGAHLTGAILTGAHLFRANLTGADLSGAHLSGADLFRADLTGADLTGADLTGADLFRADLSGAHLTGADLSGAHLTGADLTGANLRGARHIDVARNLADARYLEDAIVDPGVRERLGLPPAAPGNPERDKAETEQEAEE